MIASVPETAGVRQLQTDDAAWDAFVERAPVGTFAQLSAWADANTDRGWRPVRVVADSPDGLIGAQVLVHRMRPGPWSRGYAMRGPVALRYTRASVAAFTDALRKAAGSERLTHVYIDPELPRGEVEGALFEAAGWQRAPRVQPNQTRVIDLRAPEEEIWSGLRSSARWSVNKARRSGITVHQLGADGLADFGVLFEETMERVQLNQLRNYRDVFAAFDHPAGAGVSIVLARAADGVPLATVMLIGTGERMVELYGASNRAGAKARANYLVKWEAIARSRERGFATYDMWGTDEPNLAEFKQGFGGRELLYDGAFELVTNRPGRVALEAFRRVRAMASRNGRS